MKFQESESMNHYSRRQFLQASTMLTLGLGL
jgi:hypothetical protein